MNMLQRQECSSATCLLHHTDLDPGRRLDLTEVPQDIDVLQSWISHCCFIFYLTQCVVYICKIYTSILLIFKIVLPDGYTARCLCLIHYVFIH